MISKRERENTNIASHAHTRSSNSLEPWCPHCIDNQKLMCVCPELSSNDIQNLGVLGNH